MRLRKFDLLLLLLLFFTPVKSEGEYSFFLGTFDTIDKEGDDKANLYGFEHKNPILFRDTILGKFYPISGGFITDKNSIYLYTGVQAQYEMGPLNIIPSFAPGYYEKGYGKDLGSVLEFKSEISFSFDISKNSTLGYSYSHVSNNDWGKGGKNPGVDNKAISFSKIF